MHHKQTYRYALIQKWTPVFRCLPTHNQAVILDASTQPGLQGLVLITEGCVVQLVVSKALLADTVT